MKTIFATIPIGRTGHPPDMAGLAIFLASAASTIINGEIVRLDDC